MAWLLYALAALGALVVLVVLGGMLAIAVWAANAPTDSELEIDWED